LEQPILEATINYCIERSERGFVENRVYTGLIDRTMKAADRLGGDAYDKIFPIQDGAIRIFLQESIPKYDADDIRALYSFEEKTKSSYLNAVEIAEKSGFDMGKMYQDVLNDLVIGLHKFAGDVEAYLSEKERIASFYLLEGVRPDHTELRDYASEILTFAHQVATNPNKAMDIYKKNPQAEIKLVA